MSRTWSPSKQQFQGLAGLCRNNGRGCELQLELRYQQTGNKKEAFPLQRLIHHMVLFLAPGSTRPRVLPVEMDSHSDHMGQGPGQRQHSPSRQLMMPPYPPSLQPQQHHYQGSEIPSTNKPSPVPVTNASLFQPESASSSNSSSLCILFKISPFYRDR